MFQDIRRYTWNDQLNHVQNEDLVVWRCENPRGFWRAWGAQKPVVGRVLTALIRVIRQLLPIYKAMTVGKQTRDRIKLDANVAGNFLFRDSKKWGLKMTSPKARKVRTWQEAEGPKRKPQCCVGSFAVSGRVANLNFIHPGVVKPTIRIMEVPWNC